MPGTGTLSKSVAVQNEDSELWIGREILDPDTQPGGEFAVLSCRRRANSTHPILGCATRGYAAGRSELDVFRTYWNATLTKSKDAVMAAGGTLRVLRNHRSRKQRVE